MQTSLVSSTGARKRLGVWTPAKRAVSIWPGSTRMVLTRSERPRLRISAVREWCREERPALEAE